MSTEQRRGDLADLKRTARKIRRGVIWYAPDERSKFIDAQLEVLDPKSREIARSLIEVGSRIEPANYLVESISPLLYIARMYVGRNRSPIMFFGFALILAAAGVLIPGLKELALGLVADSIARELDVALPKIPESTAWIFFGTGVAFVTMGWLERLMKQRP